MAKKYMKKSVLVEAMQVEQGFEESIRLDEFLGDDAEVSKYYSSLDIAIIFQDLEGGIAAAHLGDYIIKDAKGKLYPCQKNVFEENYMEVHE